MRSRFAASHGGKVLKLVAAGLLAGASAACSDSGRFSSNPFTNPFASAPAAKVDRITTQSAARSAPVGSVTSQPLPSALPSATATPRVASPVLQNASPIGGAATGWTAMGGTSVSVGTNDTANSLSARYGVPVAAINAANGGIIRPGGQAVIPVYRGAGDGQAKTGLMNPVPRAVTAAAPSAAPSAAPAPAPVAAPAAPPAAPAVPPVAQAAPARQVATPLPPQRPVASQPTLKQAAKPAIIPAKPASKPAEDDDEDEDEAPAKKIVAAAPKAAPVTAARPAAPTPVPQAASPARPQPVQAAAPKPRVIPLTQQKPDQVVEAPRAADPVTTQSVPQTPPKALEPAGDKPDFRWPAKGRVISGFGSKGGNGDGIAIAVPEGTAVKAAEGGTVAYAGEELKGYGKLVLVRHDNGYVSAYAHNGELNVKRGDKVARGQTIAKSGATGNVTSPQLHFELRKGSTPVDPTKYLDN
jgi:murein DD-endopeptidase MepM/ murein hydrolase activator NlpD